MGLTDLNTTVTRNAKEVFDLLHDDLAAIEREFGRDTVSGVRAITEIGEYLRAGGGKRLRPALLLLSCKLMNYTGQGAIRLGAVVEIIHTATLVHDDIIDEAKTRRGRPAANTQWGNSKCVLAGDWLYMQAFKIAIQERNFHVLDTLIDLTQAMVEGELLQIERLGKVITIDEHFELIFSQDGLPVLGVHEAGRNPGQCQRCRSAASGRLWAQPRHGVSDRRRCARPYCVRGSFGQAGGQRSARR